MDCLDIVKKYLAENKYDGLFNDSYECGCEVKDLAPCDCESFASCEPGYFIPKDRVEFDGEHDFMISPEKL